MGAGRSAELCTRLEVLQSAWVELVARSLEDAGYST